MQLATPGRAFEELERLVGQELPLELFHGAVRRAAQAVRPVIECGTCLVTCSDEFQGEVRFGFDRDVARPLLARTTVGRRRIFSVSNMGGRVEPGALALADAHFTVRSAKEGSKLLLVEIAAHVGRLRRDSEVVYGELDRFGQRSPCCGALTLLLDPPPAAWTVRHPWFDQLSAFFGEARLEALRGRADGMRMVAAAIVHAVLQAETALADLLREPPGTPTHVLLVPAVIFNQPGSDGALAVGCHHLVSDGATLAVEHGASLRSTPEALDFDLSDGRVRVLCDLDRRSSAETRAPLAQRDLSRELSSLGPAAETALSRARDHEPVQRELHRARLQVERVKASPHAWRIYARPLLRGLVQGISVLAPEVALAAFLVEGGAEMARAKRLRQVLASGPTGPEARRVLHDVEAEIQQLGHRDAQQVLDALLAKSSPLWA